VNTKNIPNRFFIHQINAPILVAISQKSLLSKRVMSYAKVIKEKIEGVKQKGDKCPRDKNNEYLDTRLPKRKKKR